MEYTSKDVILLFYEALVRPHASLGSFHYRVTILVQRNGVHGINSALGTKFLQGIACWLIC